jgi:hypothetical protein
LEHEVKNYLKFESVDQAVNDLLTGQGKFSLVLCENFAQCRELFSWLRIALSVKQDCDPRQLLVSQPEMKFKYAVGYKNDKVVWNVLILRSAANSQDSLRGLRISKLFDATYDNVENRIEALKVLLPALLP